MLTYSQTTGRLLDGLNLLGTGYAGHGLGINNASQQAIPCVGPIPQGQWSIGQPIDSPHTGPFSIPLMPLPGTETFGRSGFFMHGDLIGHVGERIASDGCIIMPLSTREQVISLGYTVLMVTP